MNIAGKKALLVRPCFKESSFSFLPVNIALAIISLSLFLQ